MNKNIQLKGLLVCTVLTIFIILADIYFHGLPSYTHLNRIYKDWTFNPVYNTESIVKAVSDIFSLIIPLMIPWFLYFSRKEKKGYKLLLYLLMAIGLVLCFWIPSSIWTGMEYGFRILEAEPAPFKSITFCDELIMTLWIYQICFQIFLPFLILGYTRSMKGSIWLYLLCFVLMVIFRTIPYSITTYYFPYNLYFDDWKDAVYMHITTTSVILFFNYLVVLILDALFYKLYNIPKVKAFFSKVEGIIIKTMGQILADITGIGKAKYNDNTSHGCRHLLLHILLPVLNIPVQKLIMTFSKIIHSCTYYFSIGAEFRILDTLVVYLIMLLLAGIYLKCTGCKKATLIHYAVWGIVPCIMTALIMDKLELHDYKTRFCSSFEED